MTSSSKNTIGVDITDLGMFVFPAILIDFCVIAVAFASVQLENELTSVENEVVEKNV